MILPFLPIAANFLVSVSRSLTTPFPLALSLVLAVLLLYGNFSDAAPVWLLAAAVPRTLPLGPGDRKKKRQESKVVDWKNSSQQPPYSFKGGQNADRQIVVWYRPKTPEEEILTRLEGTVEWWERFSRTTLSARGLEREKRDLFEARRQVEYETVLAPYGNKSGPFQDVLHQKNRQEAYFEKILRPLRFEDRVENGKTTKRVIVLEVTSWLDRVWSELDCTRMFRRGDETVQDVLTRISSDHLAATAKLEDSPSWPRSAAFHTSLLLVDRDNKIVLTIRGWKVAMGENELTTSAAGGASHSRWNWYYHRMRKKLRIHAAREWDAIRDAMIRELREELAIRMKLKDLKFLGVATYPTDVGWDPEFHFIAKTELNEVEIRATREDAEDADESSLLVFLSLDDAKQFAIHLHIPGAPEEKGRRTPLQDMDARPPLLAALHLLLTSPTDSSVWKLFDRRASEL